MKRKRAIEVAETSQKIVKKQKSQVQRDTDDNFIPDKIINAGTLRKNPRRGTKSKYLNKDQESFELPEHFETEMSRPAQNVTKRKKKLGKDISQNGELVQDTQSVENSEILPTTLKKKKNGLQNRAASDSPSDFQPLGRFLKKAPLEVAKKGDLNLQEQEIKLEADAFVPIKKKRGRKPKALEEEFEYDLPKDNSVKKSPSIKQGVLKTLNRKKQIEETVQNNNLTIEIGGKKPKKKVRIDETESLKIKKELAEPHFSAKQLPAKIIKSKANKSLTEEVKVSPLTVQSFKKDRKNLKRGKTETGVSDEDDKTIMHEQLIANGLDHEANITSEESDLEVYYINKNAEKEARKSSPKRCSILMPKEDQLILVQRIQEVIPENDTKNYKYRLQNVEWHKVAFKNYTLEECQKVWAQLLKKVRHYRLLTEVTHDVKQLIELGDDIPAPKTRKTKPSNKHPDMPKRPISSYLLYLIRERDKIGKEKPDIDTVELNKFISERYQNLPIEKKQKYELLAAKNKEIYKQQLEEFYLKHPEMRKVVIKKEPKLPKERKEKPPKRPENPYRLFVQAELNREEISEEDKVEFKEVCREKWLQMSDSKKLGWINLAEEHHQKYEEELKEYIARHPEYAPKSLAHKSFLSRQEQNLKDKLAGKPKKPPGTAYGFFISMTMQSNEIVDIPPKERWNYTCAKWKAMKDEEREQYKQLLAQVHEQFQKDFKTYLDSLPEEKRQAEILKSLPKKRKSAAADKPSTSGRKSGAKSARSTPKTKSTKQKVQNPIPPPRSAYKYFVEKYEGENPKEAWKNLPASEKDKYEEELSAIKGKYIKEFEIYLKSLTKEELAEFCANRSSQEDYGSTEESDSASDRGDEESSDEDSSDNSDSENDSDEN